MKSNYLKLSFYLIPIVILFTGCVTPVGKESESKVLIDIGDSLTYGYGGNGTTMSSVTSQLLGEEWTVENMGVGGENTLTIGGRYGAIPMYIKEPLQLPSDTTSVEILNGIYSTYNDAKIFPLLQGAAGINPCVIEGIECELSKKGDKYYLRRIHQGSNSYFTKPNAKLVTALSKNTDGIATIFIGQNGGYESPEELLDQVKMFVKHKGDNKFIIITSHGNGSIETIQPLLQQYGNKVIDLKSYMTTTAIYDAIKLGLLPDDGTYPTADDLEHMSHKKTPSSLLLDEIHFNPIGYELLGRLRYKKGQELEYW